MPVRCNGLSHHYGAGARALDDISIELGAGVTGLVGVNGAGKSTLLRILSGGLRPSGGTVSVLGASPYGSGRRAALTATALMPQELSIPRELRAHEVVAYIGWLRGLSSRRARERSAAVLAAVGLADRADSRVSALSGGMMRRLALAQALVSDPPVLLLDEPTTGLDPEQRAAVRALIAELPEEHTIVMSSHVMEDIETLADRVLVLDEGRLLFDGTVSELVQQHGSASAEEAFLTLLLRSRAS